MMADPDGQQRFVPTWPPDRTQTSTSESRGVRRDRWSPPLPVDCPICHTATEIAEHETRHPVTHHPVPGATTTEPAKLLAYLLGCGHRVDPAEHTLIVQSGDDCERTARWVPADDQR